MSNIFSSPLVLESVFRDVFRDVFDEAFSPLFLFASGEEGAWYEPSTTTCFTDTGGTTPATYGDGVAYLEDLSGNGNHATQVTAGARPILARVPEGGRRNLLKYTEQFDDAVWNKTNSSISANTSDTTDPLGTNTADKYSNTSAADFLNTASAVTISSGTNYAVSVFAKKGTQDWLRLSFFTTTNGGAACNGWFNLNTGQTGSVLSGTEGTGVSVNIVDEGNGWYRCTLVGSTTSATTLYPTITMVTADAVTTRPATGNELYIWGAQLETGSTATAYQKVVSEYDITEAGVTSLDYLSFNADDYLLMGDVFDSEIATATGKLDVYAAASYDADGSLLAKTGDSNQSEDQRQYTVLRRNSGNSSQTFFYSLATAQFTTVGGSAISTGANYVFRAVFDHELAASGTTANNTARHKLWQNGVAETLSVVASGGNLGTIQNGTAQLVIGGRFGTAGPLADAFSGKLFGLIMLAGVVETDSLADQTETYLAAKSGVVL